MTFATQHDITNLEIIEDFIDDSRESFDEMESILTLFEWGEVGDEALGNLIQRIHSISSVLRIGGFIEASDYALAIQGTLEHIENGTLDFSEKINDIIMLSIDHLRALTEAIFTGEAFDISCFIGLAHLLNQFNKTDKSKADEIAELLLSELHKETVVWFTETSESFSVLPDNVESSDPNHAADLKQLSDADLAFFRDMMHKIEKCNSYLNQRGDQILRICSAMNKQAGHPVDPMQLEAAVYMHDFGMALVPSTPLLYDGLLDEDSRTDMHDHTLIGHMMLQRIGIWPDAATMVKQHHERVDGKGYPEGLHGEAISDGAKILAIADTVVSMISDKTYKDYKRPLIRAIAEINACKGSQFSEYWVNIFNRVMRDHKSVILS